MPKRRPAPPPGPVTAAYPHIASWVQDGYVEIGRTDWTRSVVRALDEGGMIWEGASRYPSLDAALQALDDGIAQWLEENG
jgi:hypothetical protein